MLIINYKRHSFDAHLEFPLLISDEFEVFKFLEASSFFSGVVEIEI